ncbi:hypothetical protein FO519_009054 [Halicephalobus sp. NKZ332]|nr:hypothetical protein FO519_009054 [Halicephalobus sp. NKZ332]
MSPSYQQICFFLYGLLIFCICVCPLLSETHWTLTGKDENSGARIVSLTGSPLCLKQPHSLVDLIEQDKLVREMKQLQQKLKEHGENAFYAKRKETDETRQFRASNQDCEATRDMKFSEETFSEYMDFDLMPYFTEPEEYPNPPLAKDIVNIKKLRKLYFGDLKVKQNGEPLCNKIFVSEGEDTVIKVANIISAESIPEKSLLNLSKEELVTLGELLATGLESDDFKNKFFALYYSGFYWRHLGNHREAATCLQKHLMMGISTAGFYQIGCIHSKFKDFYHSIAAFRATKETLMDPPNAQWFNAGGDVHVLAQLYRAARSYYKNALEIASEKERPGIVQKLKLINCEIGVEDLTISEETLENFNDLKSSMHNWEAKQSLMFERMLPVDQWTKAKYAYQVLTDGPLQGVSCRGNLNSKGKQVISCDLDSPRLYNQSIFLKRIEKRKKAAETIDELVTDIHQAQKQQASFLNYVLEAHISSHEYMKKLEPYLTVELNEPQGEKLYPRDLEKSKSIPETSLLLFRDRECRGLESFNVDELYEVKKDSDLVSSFPSFPEMFIPPDNKGYFASYVLTTLVALSPSEISPLPWSEPYCSSGLPEDYEIYPGLTLADFSSNLTKGLRYSEKSLKQYFSTILGKGPQAVTGDVGQRIATLLKYDIGPKWISANLGALYWRHPVCCWPGEQNVFCLEEDLKRGDKHCFKIQVKDEVKKKIEFQYVRCNGKYLKQSFKAWTIYEFLSPYFISKNEIEDMILQKRIMNISATSEEDKNLPVFALDYGGFGKERFKIYEEEKIKIEDFEQSMTDFGFVREERLRKEKESAELQKAKLTDSEFEKKINFLKTFTERKEIMALDTLMSLGHKHERVEHVSARLHLAMKTSKLNPKHSHLQDDGVNGVITAVSTLYWRVKGDAVNALKCLRHALKNLPRNMKDTALISMANIYHQAGFLHSALIVGGKAHQMTPNLVSIHFTLANIYATMGDHTRALKFYYSTLALQPNFQPAKERIRAIYCLTHGKVKI